MSDINKFTSKEVLNKVLLDSSGNSVAAFSHTTQEALNAALDTTNNRLNMSLAGGTISGDVTITGDLTVNGSDTNANFDEIINGSLAIGATDKFYLDGGTDTYITESSDGVIDFYGDTKLLLTLKQNGTQSEVVVNESSFDCDFRIESDANTHAFFVQASDSKVGIGNASDGNVDTPLHILVEGGGSGSLLNGIKMEDPAISGTEHLGILFSGRSDNAGGKAYMGAVRADNFGVMDLVFYTDSAADDNSVTTSDNVMTFTHDGRLGIGTAGANVDSQLHVQDDSSNCTVKIEASASGTGARLQMISATNDTAEFYLGDADDTNIGRISYNHTSNYLAIHTNDTEKFRIDSSGDVGIGTSAPNYNSTAMALTVLGGNSEDIGSVEIIGHTDSGGTAVARLYMGNRAGSQDDLVYLETKTGTGASDGVLCFYTSASGTPTKNFELDANSRISLSNNDASGAVGTTLFGYQAALNLVSGAENGTYIGHMVAGNGTITNAADSNTAMGFKSMFDLTSGSANTAVGYRSAFDLTSGTGNTALGSDALKGTNDGTNNVAIGKSAIEANCGNYNVAVGSEALLNTTASSNVGIGFRAGKAVTSGADNILIGHNAGLTMTDTADTVLIGRDAGKSIDHSDATGTVCIGKNAGELITQGQYSTIIGFNSGMVITTADATTTLGYEAGKAITTQNNCTLIGYQAGLAINNDNAANSTLIGYKAGVAITDGKQNTAVGVNALLDCTSADYNVAVGNNALENVSTGSNNMNTGIGYASAATLTTGTNNTLLGAQADVSTSAATGQIAIGQGVACTGDNTATLGIGSNTASLGLDGSDTSWAAASSDERLKENIETSSAGLGFINDLRPVTYNWKKAKDVDESLPQYEDSNNPVLGKEYGETLHGFIAQEVKQAIDSHEELADGFKMWKLKDDGTQTVADGNLVPILVKAVQELSAKVEELEEKLK